MQEARCQAATADAELDVLAAESRKAHVQQGKTGRELEACSTKVRTVKPGKICNSLACMFEGERTLMKATSEMLLCSGAACVQRREAEGLLEAAIERQTAAEQERERLLQELVGRDTLLAACTTDLEDARPAHPPSRG